MGLIRNIITIIALGLGCAVSYAQSNVPPTPLDRLAAICREVTVLNDTVNARQATLNQLKNQLDSIKQNWWKTCNDALSSPDCDNNDKRKSTLIELISLTHPEFEADILAQLEEAKNDFSIRKLAPLSKSSSKAPRGGASDKAKPTQGDKSQAKQSPANKENEKGGDKKDKPSAPETKDPKKNDHPPVEPDKQEKKEQGEDHDDGSQDETNRNNAIKAMMGL